MAGAGEGGEACRYTLRFPRSDMTSAELSVTFFLHMFFILAACRAVGWVARRCGQPQAVGEMIAGALRGPSRSGLFLPGARASIRALSSKACGGVPRPAQ